MISRSVAKTYALAAALAPVLLLNSQPAAAACEEQVETALRDMGIAAEDVSSIEVMRRGAGGKASNNYRMDAWVALKSCPDGKLIINMTRHCVVHGSYTTGDCRVAEAPGD